MEGLVTEYLKGINPDSPGIDQLFLRDIIYPRYASHSSFVHDQWTAIKEPHAVPIKRDLALDDFAFIGEAIDENGLDRFADYRGEQRTVVKEYYYAK